MSRKAFANIEDAEDYLLGSDISETMTVIPPDVDELTDEDKVDEENLDASINCYITGGIEIVDFNEELDEQQNPLTSKRPRKAKSELKWQKNIPRYTKRSAHGNYAATKFESVAMSLQNATPLQIFEKNFSDDVIQLIIDETIRYAKVQKNKHDFDIATMEIKIFLGFLILSEYYQLPIERDYWSENDDLGLGIVRDAFSRNANATLKAMIHFQDNSKAGECKDDKAFKVRSLIDKINAKFQQCGVFKKYLSVDEMIIRYYANHGLKQFIRAKPIRFGCKLWALCSVSGFCFHFSLYCGKEPKESQSTAPLGNRVIHKLFSVVEEPSSYVIFFDNFFTSYSLLCELQQKGFRTTGTIRDNRTNRRLLKTPQQVEKMTRGSYDYRFEINDEVLTVRWKDNKAVGIASNFDTILPEVSVQRWSSENKSRIPIVQPYVIHTYNNYMGGVDHHDWLLEKHFVSIRGKKWYWSIFTRILDMAVVNSFVPYRLIHGSNSISIKDFCRAITTTYLKLGHGSRVIRGRPLSLPSTSRRQVAHDIRLEKRNYMLSNKDKRRRCQYQKCKGKPLTCCNKS